MRNKVINSLLEGSESRIYQQMELFLRQFREQHLQQMELLLRLFREQNFPVDGTVVQTVQRAAFTSRWNCSESSIYKWMELLLRQFREWHLPVDGTVAQTVRREAFTSIWNCCSDSSESNIYQRRGTKYVLVLSFVAFHGSKPRVRSSLKLQIYIKSGQKFLFQNFSCIECRIQAKYEKRHKIQVLQFSSMPYSFEAKNCG